MASSAEFIVDKQSSRLNESAETLPADAVSRWVSKMTGYAALLATCGFLARTVL